MLKCISLEWAEEPNIAPCAVGEPADFRGLKIFANYPDGSKVPMDVTMKMFHEANMQETVNRSAHIVYEKKKLTVDIPMKDAVLLRIESAITPASSLIFREGDSFDKSRVIITAHYSDGTSREIDNYKTFPYLPLTLDDKSITFKYGRCTSELPLTVLSQNAPVPAPDRKEMGVSMDIDGILASGQPVKEPPGNSPAPSKVPQAPNSPVPNQPPSQTQAPAQTNTQTPPKPSRPQFHAPAQTPTRTPTQAPVQNPAPMPPQAPIQPPIQQPAQPSPQIPSQTPFQSPSQISTQPPYQYTPQAPVPFQTPAPVPAPPTKTVIAVSVARKPNRQKYLAGDTLVDLKGGRLDIIYSDGTVGQIDMIADGPVYINSKKPGEGSISFDCLGSPVSFPIDVLEPKIAKLSVAKMPAKVDYIEGEILNLAGLVLEATYNDGSVRTIRGLQSNGLEVNLGHAEEGVTLSYEDEPFTVKINVKKKDVPVSILSIELVQEPDKTKYIEGESGGIDPAGAAILAQMSDGRRERIPVTRAMLDPVDLSRPGRCLLTIRYMGFSTSCSIFILSKTLEKIELKSGLRKTEYIEGEDIDLRGVLLEACYNNGVRVPITDYEVSPETARTGVGSVVFRYKNFEASAPITVQPLQVTLVDLIRLPAKTIYYTHEKVFSCDGGVLRIKRNNGTEEEVPLTPEMVSGFRTDRVGPLSLRILCAGKVIPFSVMVQERALLGLRVTHKPRLEYIEGEEFDPEGLVVEAVYSGETSKVVGVTYLPYGPLRLDTTSVMLVYQDKAVVMPITVSKPKSPEHLPIITTPLNPDMPLSCTGPAKESLPATGLPEPLPQPTAKHEPQPAAKPEPIVFEPAPADVLAPVPSPVPEPDSAPAPVALKNKSGDSTKDNAGDRFVTGKRQGDSIEDPFADDELKEDSAGKEQENAALPEDNSSSKKRRKSSVPVFYPSTFGMRFMEETD